MSIESVMPSNHLILCCPLFFLPSIFPSCLQSFPASELFPMSQFFASGGQSIGASASASVLPMNIQDCFLLGWTGLISLQSKGLSKVFSNTTVQKHQFFGICLNIVYWCFSFWLTSLCIIGSRNWQILREGTISQIWIRKKYEIWAEILPAMKLN